MIKNILLIILISAMPLMDARYGFPIGYKLLNQNIYISLIAAYTGNLLTILIINWVLFDLIKKYQKNYFIKQINKITDVVLNFVKTKHQKRIETFAMWSLTSFIAIPLPFSGSHTGTVIGYLIGLNKKQNIACACIGSFISLMIVFITIESIDISSKFFIKFFQ